MIRFDLIFSSGFLDNSVWLTAAEAYGRDLIYKKGKPRAVWECSVWNCEFVFFSAHLYFFSPAPEVTQIPSHISFCGSHGSQKCTWPRGTCTHSFCSSNTHGHISCTFYTFTPDFISVCMCLNVYCLPSFGPS